MPPAPSRRMISKSARRAGTGRASSSDIGPPILPRPARQEHLGVQREAQRVDSSDMQRPALLLVLALSSVGTMACGVGSRHGNGPNSADNAPIEPAKIGDAQFAAATYQLLLSDEKSPERN